MLHTKRGHASRQSATANCLEFLFSFPGCVSGSRQCSVPVSSPSPRQAAAAAAATCAVVTPGLAPGASCNVADRTSDITHTMHIYTDIYTLHIYTDIYTWRQLASSLFHCRQTLYKKGIV